MKIRVERVIDMALSPDCNVRVPGIRMTFYLDDQNEETEKGREVCLTRLEALGMVEFVREMVMDA